MTKRKVGYTCGVFDLLHIGHLNLLERCKERCDYLIVGICDDAYVEKIKNTTPVFDETERLRIIRALKVVDRAELVSIEETEDKMKAIQRFDFNILFSGSDWQYSQRYLETEKEFEKVGAEIVYLPYTNGISTSDIKNRLNNNDK